MLNTTVLIVDDERSQAEALRRMLAMEGFRAVATDSPNAALEEIAIRPPDVVISDFRMGSMTGLDLFLRIRDRHPQILFIIVTAFGSFSTAVEALKAGVHDYLSKPIDTDELVIKLKKALKLRTLESENVQLKERIIELAGGGEIIARSGAMRAVLEKIDQVARSASTVLITGESGTGKELIARTLHLKSPRREGPYVKVNCAAIPENLLESELFGHEAGAFTGATQRREGKFALADGGSIFLDEIGEMPLHLQSKILRVLQEREVERLGGNDVLRIDVRVIAATNRDLGEMVRDGEFREDLFYRLAVIPIDIPPLRTRIDDVVPLAEHFHARFCAQNGRDLKPLSAAVKAKLQGYPWPGNVRELENWMERAVVLARGDELGPDDFALGDEADTGLVDSLLETMMGSGLTLDEVERQLILGALERSRGNVSKAARALGLTRRTLQYRLDKIRDGGKDDDG